MYVMFRRRGRVKKKKKKKEAGHKKLNEQVSCKDEHITSIEEATAREEEEGEEGKRRGEKTRAHRLP